MIEERTVQSHRSLKVTKKKWKMIKNSHLDPKITYDRENRKYRIKFSWPSEKDIPVSVVTPGKRTKKPV